MVVPRGDCYVCVTVKDHPLFVRDGQNLIVRAPVGYAQAALGCTLEVPTLEGREELKIPAGTQSGEVLKLRGRGIPHPRGRQVGDLLVQVVIDVPKHLTAPAKGTAARIGRAGAQARDAAAEEFLRKGPRVFRAQ